VPIGRLQCVDPLAVGSTSPPQTVTLSNPGVGQLDLTSIVLSGSDFAETSACGASLAAGATCTLSVTFTPVATGPRTGSINITGSAPDSPQTIPGAIAAYDLKVGPVGGFK